MSAGNKVLRDIVTDLEAVLNKCGVMYHVFYRTKSEMSIKNKLEKNGINVTIRREMGRDIDGACGQLRKSYIGK